MEKEIAEFIGGPRDGGEFDVTGRPNMSILIISSLGLPRDATDGSELVKVREHYYELWLDVGKLVYTGSNDGLKEITG